MSDARPEKIDPLRYVAWLLALLAGTIWLSAVTVNAHVGWNEITGRVFAGILGMFVPDISTGGQIVRVGMEQMKIAFGCNGILAFCVLVSAALPFPCCWRQKALVLLAGLLYVFVINQLRLLLLAALLLHIPDKSQFDLFHAGIGQPFAMLMIFLFFIGWLHFCKPLAVQAAPPAD